MTKQFWKAAANRALRTFCQTFISMCGGAIILEDVKWWYVISASTLAAMLSIFTSIITDLPEVSTLPKEPKQMSIDDYIYKEDSKNE